MEQKRTEKERQKRQKQEEKEAEKRKKEEEKRKKEEEKEAEKRKKEEDKRKKEEEKEAEKRKKEEEKRKKEEEKEAEKRREEEKEKRKMMRTSQAFTSFFTSKRSSITKSDDQPSSGAVTLAFPPFQVMPLIHSWTLYENIQLQLEPMEKLLANSCREIHL